MLKRIYSLLLIIIILGSINLSVFATSYQEYNYSVFTPQSKAYNIGNYISEDTLEKFNQNSKAIESSSGINMVFIITNELNGSVEEFSDYVFLKSPLGKEYNDNIIMLVVDMTGRRVDLYTHGTGMQVITDTKTNYILDEVAVPALKSKDYDGLVDEFAKISKQFIQEWLDVNNTTKDNSEAVNTDVVAVEKKETVDSSLSQSSHLILTGILIGGVFTLILTTMRILRHRPVKSAYSANEYASEGSFQLTKKSDFFKRTHTTKVALPKDRNNNTGNGMNINRTTSHSHSTRNGMNINRTISHSHSSGNRDGGGSRGF
ncbi:MAG: TPM domain-containing protein [Lachnospiraceae bacterium]|nr:TPM domain-containing protein [Lachnospiraceae bacterium]